jgi:signal peptidase I
MRRLLAIGVATLLLSLAVGTWLVEGLVVPVVVSGGSMAPALNGEHFEITCHDCRFRFACGAESPPTTGQAVCPNCGATNDLTTAAARPGDRVLIDRRSGRFARWQLVVLQAPDDATTLCVKRSVGLPGETVEIRGGDVYVNAEPARRTLDEVLAMAIPVYDSRFAAAQAKSRHWRPEPADSGWCSNGTGYEHRALSKTAQTSPSGSTLVEWLVYEHQQVIGRGGAAIPSGPILDDLSYNQGESRQLVAVPDVLLRCRAESSTGGTLWLRSSDGRREFVVRLDAATGLGEVTTGEERLTQFSAGPAPLEHNPKLVLALVDRQLRLAIDGRVLVDQVYDLNGADFRPTARPLAIGAQDLSLRVSDIVVLRDVYYLAADRHAGSAAAPRQLGADEYWLLGDNTSVSRDSRAWPPVYANSLIGKVLAIYHR